jgi:TMEM175 potassium channel family protein
MTKTRLEAFSDGVIAILITIMVLELRAPQGAALSDLREVVPSILMYVLSFVLVGIYWVNHHHMIHATDKVNGAVLWANLHLLFWLSLIPFVTQWMGRNHYEALPTAMYGVVLVLAAIAYTILQQTIVNANGRNSTLARAVGGDRKGKISLAIYVVAIPLAFVNPRVSDLLYVIVAVVWFIPDRRIERVVGE